MATPARIPNGVEVVELALSNHDPDKLPQPGPIEFRDPASERLEEQFARELFDVRRRVR